MANQLPVEVRIAEKMLDYLTGRSAIIQYCNKQYSKDFTADPAGWKQGIGQTINVAKPPRYQSMTGPSITSVQDINIGTMPVTINQWRTVALQLGGWEMNFSARDFDVWAEKNIKPVVDPILTDLETAIFGLSSQIANFVGVQGTGFGTTANSAVDLLGAAREKLTLAGDTPMEDCVAFVNPTGARKFAYAVAGGFNPQGEISETIRKQKIFENANFKVFQAANVATVSQAAWTIAGNVVASTSQTTGSTLIVTNVGGNSGLYPTVGQKFNLTGTGAVYSVRPMSKVNTGLLQDFTILSVSNNGTTTTTMQIYPPIITTGAFQNVSNAPTAGTTAFTIISNAGATLLNCPYQMAFWKNCLGVVTVPVKAPEGLRSRTVNYDGMSITLSSGSDIKDFVQIWRADMVFGVTLFYPENACVFPN